jgi:hypothetical protein
MVLFFAPHVAFYFRLASSICCFRRQCSGAPIFHPAIFGPATIRSVSHAMNPCWPRRHSHYRLVTPPTASGRPHLHQPIHRLRIFDIQSIVALNSTDLSEAKCAAGITSTSPKRHRNPAKSILVPNVIAPKMVTRCWESR